MNTKIIWSILGVIIVAIALYFTVSNNQTNTQTQVNNEASNNSNVNKIDSSSTPQSLKELLTLKQSIRCEFDTNEENNSSGVVQASNGKARVDFTSTSEDDNNETITGHMIISEDTAHTWLDNDAKGYKISVDKMTEVENTTKSSQIDLNKKLEYRCENEDVDNSIFILPDNIEFTDVNNMMIPSEQGEIKSDTSETMKIDPKAAQCAACNQAPEASRAQCLVALGCN